MAEIASPPSDAEGQYFINKLVWIKDPLDPSKNYHWAVTDDSLKVKAARPSDVQISVEASLPIATTDGLKGESFSITFLIMGVDQWKAMQELMAEVKTVLVQSTRSQWYAQITGDVDRDERLWDRVEDLGEDEVRTVTLIFTEVEAP